MKKEDTLVSLPSMDSAAAKDFNDSMLIDSGKGKTTEKQSEPQLLTDRGNEYLETDAPLFTERQAADADVCDFE